MLGGLRVRGPATEVFPRMGLDPKSVGSPIYPYPVGSHKIRKHIYSKNEAGDPYHFHPKNKHLKWRLDVPPVRIFHIRFRLRDGDLGAFFMFLVRVYQYCCILYLTYSSVSLSLARCKAPVRYVTTSGIKHCREVLVLFPPIKLYLTKPLI